MPTPIDMPRTGRPRKYGGYGHYQPKTKELHMPVKLTLQEQIDTLTKHLDTLRDYVQDIDNRINAFADVLEESGEVLS